MISTIFTAVTSGYTQTVLSLAVLAWSLWRVHDDTPPDATARRTLLTMASALCLVGFFGHWQVSLSVLVMTLATAFTLHNVRWVRSVTGAEVITRQARIDQLRNGLYAAASTIPPPAASTNAHPRAANRRRNARLFVDHFQQREATAVHTVSMSRRDKTNGAVGDRMIRDIQDAGTHEKEVDRLPEHGEWIRMDDTISHLSNHELSAHLLEERPIIGYTWGPHSVGGKSDEMSFSTEDGETFDFKCPGTMPLSHRLWDFGDDFNSFRTWRFRAPSATLCILGTATIWILKFAGFWLLMSQFYSASFMPSWWPVYLPHIVKVQLNVPFPDEIVYRFECLYDGGHCYSLLWRTIELWYPGLAWLPNIYELLVLPAVAWTVAVMSILTVICSGPETIVTRTFVRDVGGHRAVVLILPVARYSGWLSHAIHASKLNKPLKRINYRTFEHEGRTYVVHQFVAKDQYLSIAMAGAVCSQRIGVDDYTEACDMAGVRRTALTHRDLKMLLSDRKYSNAAIANLLIYIRSGDGHNTSTVQDRDYLTQVFTHGKSAYDDIPTPRLRQVMDHTLPGRSLIAATTLENEEYAVSERVTKLQNTKEPAPLTGREATYAREFAEHILAHAGNAPVNLLAYDEVEEAQKTAAARAQLNATEIFGHIISTIASFLKLESLCKFVPRLISPLRAPEKMSSVSLARAITPLFYPLRWYGFGRPADVERKVYESAVAAEQRGADFAVLSDYSRYDGRTRAVMHSVFAIIVPALVAEDDRELARTILRDTRDRKGRTTLGHTYDTGNSIISGHGCTSILGSIGNAFIAYDALRELDVSEVEAWDWLGVFGGDDGVTYGIEPEHYQARAARYGHKLTIDVRTPSDARRKQFNLPDTIRTKCIDFFARVWGPHIWEGDSNSMCDVPRALAKFGLTHLADGEHAMRVKAACYAMNDAETPHFGEFLAKVANCHSLSLTDAGLTYNAEVALTHGSCYTNHLAWWMEERLKEDEPDIDWARLDAWSNDPESDPMRPPPLIEPEAIIPPTGVEVIDIPTSEQSAAAALQAAKDATADGILETSSEPARGKHARRPKRTKKK